MRLHRRAIVVLYDYRNLVVVVLNVLRDVVEVVVVRLEAARERIGRDFARLQRVAGRLPCQRLVVAHNEVVIVVTSSGKANLLFVIHQNQQQLHAVSAVKARAPYLISDMFAKQIFLPHQKDSFEMQIASWCQLNVKQTSGKRQQNLTIINLMEIIVRG